MHEPCRKRGCQRKTTEDVEVQRNSALQETSAQRNTLNRISDDESEHMDTLDGNEPDILDLEYELNENIAVQEAVAYKVDSDRDVKLGNETITGLRLILEKTRKHHEIHTEHMITFSQQHGKIKLIEILRKIKERKMNN